MSAAMAGGCLTDAVFWRAPLRATTGNPRAPSHPTQRGLFISAIRERGWRGHHRPTAEWLHFEEPRALGAGHAAKCLRR